MNISRSSIFSAFVIVSVLSAASAVPAMAGLAGQPAPSAEVVSKIRNESLDVLRGNIATGRPNLYLLVQDNAATDFTGLLQRVVGDDTTYAGITETLEEAVASAKDGAQKQYILYNLAQVHLLRSQFVHLPTSRSVPLEEAARAVAQFDPDLRDPAAWELKGDIDAERGKIDDAIAAYKKMSFSGAPGAEVQYKYAWAYERSNRNAQAAADYRAAQLAQSMTGAGGPKLRHEIYQGLARLALKDGNDPAALSDIALSARVDQDEATPFHFRLEAAKGLLIRGYARQVLAYAEAALRAVPDDDEARDLRDRAQAALQRGQ